MKIVKCLKCGREFTQHFPESFYWAKKQWCPACRVEEEEDSKKIDEAYLTERRKAMDSLSGFGSVVEDLSSSEPGSETPDAFVGGGGSFGGGGASAAWEPSSEPSTGSEPEPSCEPSESSSSSDSSSSDSSSSDSSSGSGD